MRAVTATLHQPVAAGTGLRKAGVQASEDYLTGTVLRGALAARWIARHGAPTTVNPCDRGEFERLFEGDVGFGPLLPPATVPMPMSCWIHKYDPEPGCPRWWDEALGRTPGGDGLPRCPHCALPLQRGSGQLTTVRDGRTVAAVDVVEDTHTEIGPDGRVVPKNLFARQRIRAGQVFTGLLLGADTDLDLITAGVTRVWLGGRRSTSGLATLTVEQAPAAPSVQRLGDRHLVLRLAQPGIFVDDYGRPQPDPHPRDLQRAFGVRARVERRWMRWTTVSGWHAASGFAKPGERCAARGSTYLIGCDKTPTDAALAADAARGIGLRRVEGFGAFVGGPDAVLAPLLTDRPDEGGPR